ncbi:salicylate synthase [Nocardiopsis mangrovi]|uniref:Salicylate synthase n=1 Tax=Nocardiopsis mangrovi TaxID=1179818 RepID=A0ABV9E486_9ACTN
MFTVRRYHELRIPGRFEPMQLAGRLAGSGLFEGHVVYERDGHWWFAGDPLADVVLDGATVRSTVDGRTRVEPWAAPSLAQVGDALARADVRGWRAFGWAAFELAYAIAGLPRPAAAGEPLLHLFVPRTEVRMGTDELVVRTLDEHRLADVRDLLREPAGAPSPAAPTPVSVAAAPGRDAYRAGVAAAVADIRAGLLGKVILSREVEVPFDADLPATYALGRANNTPSRSFLLDLGGWKAAGFSPETVAEVSPDGRVATLPLAGTRALGGEGGGAADADRRADLLSDPKEVYEHAASVKLACDELEGLCAPGSVAVTEFMRVKERGSVQHLGSRIDGRLGGGRSALDAFAALFPAITASGIPKRAAYERIRALEERPRGLYAGAVLVVSDDGALDSALVLRAIYQRGGRTWLRAGAGIVAGSTPDREYEETCEKLGSIAPYVVRRAREAAPAEPVAAH